MSSQRRLSIVQRQRIQLRAFGKFNVTALLTLPYRLCNPPPAVGKVRSCTVTPIFKVRLEDVLNRKHLPPLGLKDFEEWLLYIEKCPENLYFILWLKEYTGKYNQWALQSKSRKQNVFPSAPHSVTSSSLALFYARAKQTFFTPNRSSPYELKVSSDILSPFHTSNLGSSHPDPAVFTQVATEVQKMLAESLDRMVTAAYTNMGSNRTMCGIVCGLSMMLIGCIPPLVVNFVNRRDRWLRLLAIPGMWLGLTFALTSLHGVCLVLYVFGDLRQLRKFELARPPISRPRTISNPQHRPVVSPPFNRAASGPTQPRILPVSQPACEHLPSQPGHLDSFSQAAVSYETPRVRTHSSSSTSSSLHTASSRSGSGYISSSSAAEQDNRAELVIEVSSVIYDDFAIEGPATGTHTSARFSVPEFTPTASFIHPYDPLCSDDFDGIRELSPEERQGIEPFDFDLLPKRSFTFPQRDGATSVTGNDTTEVPPVADKDGGDVNAELRSANDILKHEGSNRDLSTNPEKTTNTPSPPRRAIDPAIYFKAVNAVPVFSSVTPVWSPVVARAHWEIVVRSMTVGGLVCWIIIGCLLAIPDH